MSFESKGPMPVTIYITRAPDRSGNIICEDGETHGVKIQSAIDEVERLGGGTIALGHGIYDIGTDALVFDHSYLIEIALVGAGVRSTELTTTENIDMVDLGSSRVRIENMGIHQNGGTGDGIICTPSVADEVGARSTRLRNLRFWGFGDTSWCINLTNPSRFSIGDIEMWQVGNGMMFENSAGAVINYGNGKIHGNNLVHLDADAGIGLEFLSSNAPTSYMNLIHVCKYEVNVHSGSGQVAQEGIVFDGSRSITVEYAHLERVRDGIVFVNTPVDCEVKGGYMGENFITNEVVGGGTRCFVDNMARMVLENRGVEVDLPVDAVAMVSRAIAHGLHYTPNHIQLTLKRNTAVNNYAIGFLRYRTVGAVNFTVDMFVTAGTGGGGDVVDLDWEADARQF